MKKCKCGFLEEIQGFGSPYEFQRFQEYIVRQIEKNELIEIELLFSVEYKSGYGVNHTKWYQCLGCSEIWRLVEPDAPFYGYWGPVEEMNNASLSSSPS